MATYYVMKKNENESDGLQSYVMPMINIVPALIYSAVFRQHFFPDLAGVQKFALCGVFFLAYMVLSFLPYVSLITNIASTIMFVGMIWALVDHIGSDVVRIIAKVITAAFVGLLELAIFFDRTVKMK